MFEKLEGVLDRFEQLEQLLSDPDVIKAYSPCGKVQGIQKY
jgi:protein subunit release factor A